MRLACLLLLLLLLPPATAAAGDYRVVDLLAPFALYAAEARDVDAAARGRLWSELLEAPHRRFFEEVIYRALEGEERERYRQECQRRFWEEMAPGITELARRAGETKRRIESVVESCRKKLEGFEAATDFYITLSFSFRGKVVEVDGRNVMALGMELLPAEGPEMEITIAHELFHLHHFRFFDPKGAIYRTLWTEGLATYAAALLVPGHRRSTYLGFDIAKMDRCEELLPRMRATLLENLAENDARLKRIHFGAEENDAGVPPEGGYYVGLLLAEEFARSRSLDALARLGPKEVLPLLREALARGGGGGGAG